MRPVPSAGLYADRGIHSYAGIQRDAVIPVDTGARSPAHDGFRRGTSPANKDTGPGVLGQPENLVGSSSQKRSCGRALISS